MKKYVIFWFSFFILRAICFSQNSISATNNIDSIIGSLTTSKNDTNKVNVLNKLFLEFEFTDDKKASEYLNKSLQLAKDLNYKRGLALTYLHFGYFADDKGNYPDALKNYFAALKIQEVLGDKKSVADLYGCIGIIYDNQGNYPESLKKYFASLKIYEALGTRVEIADCYNNIGIVYDNQGNYPEALKHHLASLKIEQETGDQVGIANSFTNIGIIYEKQGNYPEALKYYYSSLTIMKKETDDNGMSHNYNNIGVVQYDLHNYTEALNNHFIALKIRQKLGDKVGITSSYCNIGNALLAQKKYSEAKLYLDKAKEIAKEIGAKENLKFAYNYLTTLNSSTGNYREALRSHKLYIAYRDSLDNEETRKKTIQNQMTYEFEKKEAVSKAEHKQELENHQALAKEKQRKQYIIIVFVIGVLVLVAVFLGFIFRSLRITKKQKHIIEEQKTIVEKQKHLVEENQKEIIDSITYSKRLQKAILPSAEEIKKHLHDNFVLFKPKDIVAGDFYWMHVSNDNTVYIAAADSTGHGVPGAMVSVVCSNALNRAVTEFNQKDTGRILDKTRELVLETFAKSGEEIKDGMDISLLAINKEKKYIGWSGANNPLWYIHNSELLEIKPNKEPIGKTDNLKPFTTHSIEYDEGDIFYLITDGFADQFGGPKGKKFKQKQLQEVLITNSCFALSKQKELLERSFDLWKGNLEQIDDVTIITIKV